MRFLVSILALLGLCGCPFQKPSSFEKSHTLRIQLDKEPVTLDPTLAEDGVSLEVLSATSEGLMGYTAEGHLEPRLSQSSQASADGRHFDLQLRDGLRWSDGKEIEAEDFVRAIQRAVAKGSTSPLGPLLYVIQNAKEVHAGSKTPSELGVHAQGKHVLFDLERPTPYFLHLLTLTCTFPLPKHLETPIEKTPAAGEFRLAFHKLEDRYELERNPFYWKVRSEPPTALRVDRIVFQIVHDETTAMQLFEQGHLDVLTRVGVFDLQRLKKKGRIQTAPFLATYSLQFNCKRGSTQDVGVRRTIASAVDRTSITRALGGGEHPAVSWIPPLLEGHYSIPEPSAQPVMPKSFPRELMLGFDNSARNIRIFEIVQQNLKQKLGVSVVLNTLDWKSYLRELHTSPPSVFRMGWLSTIADPVSHLQPFTSKDPNNLTGCSDPRYDALVDEIRGLAPGPERLEKILLAQEILLHEMVAVVPLYHYVQNVAVAERVVGLKMNGFGSGNWGEVRLGL